MVWNVDAIGTLNAFSPTGSITTAPAGVGSVRIWARVRHDGLAGSAAGTVFAQIEVIGFDGQIELEALRLNGLPEDALTILFGCPSLPAGTRTLALETSWDPPSLGPGATANVDVTVPGARRDDFADASPDNSSIAFVLDCHVWSNDKVRVTARNVSASTLDLAAAPLAVQATKRRLP